jgi:pyridine nucleotide-disulfide oxidoreductase
MECVPGPDMGNFVRALHEERGVIFHLEDTVVAIDGKRATLKGGGMLEADVVVVGVGLRPRLGLAEQAGLSLERGITVNAFLETSIPKILRSGRYSALARSAFGRKYSGRALGGGVSARDRLRPAICWERVRCSMWSHFSGASIMMCRSITLVLPKGVTRLLSTAASRPGIVCRNTKTRTAYLRSRRSTVTWQAELEKRNTLKSPDCRRGRVLAAPRCASTRSRPFSM